MKHEAMKLAIISSGGMPLHIAAASGDLKKAKELLAGGADVYATDNDGKIRFITLLYLAIKQ
jgi:ankyrin repeat protein